MRVRDLAWGDFEDLIQNYYSYYDELPENPTLGLLLFAQKPSRADETHWFARMYSEVERGTRVVSVAEVDGRAVGLAEVAQKGPQDEQAHVGGLGIAIRREYRGQGVGHRLMENVLEKARHRFEIVELTVLSVNERARALYQKHGFRTIGTLPRALKRGDRFYDEVIMVLDFSRPPSSP